MSKRKIRLIGYPYIIGLFAAVVVALPIEFSSKLEVLFSASVLFFILTATYFGFLAKEFRDNLINIPRSVKTLMASSTLAALILGMALLRINQPLFMALLIYSLAALFFILMYETYHEN